MVEEIVFSQYTINFAKIALEYCMLIERIKESNNNKKIFVSNMTKVLPLLYLKVSIIPRIKNRYELELENKIDENFCFQIEKNVSELLGNDNLYLETFHPDISLSSSPINIKISEDLADIYRNLGNFITIFKNGDKKTMNDSLLFCIESFKKYWGQCVVNALQALHYIKYQ